MAKVIYSMNVSLDGYVEDPSGSFAFSVPAEDVHREANEQTRAATAFLFGRGLYEVMEEPWTQAAQQPDVSQVEAEFAREYLATPRIVFSDTLEEVPDGVTLVRSRDAAAEVTRLKAEMKGELSIGGAGLAASMVDHIDEFRLFVMPVAVSGGKPFFAAKKELCLRLIEHRRFDSGAMYLCYERAR